MLVDHRREGRLHGTKDNLKTSNLIEIIKDRTAQFKHYFLNEVKTGDSLNVEACPN